jgi:hypothetical protein
MLEALIYFYIYSSFNLTNLILYSVITVIIMARPTPSLLRTVSEARACASGRDICLIRSRLMNFMGMFQMLEALIYFYICFFLIIFHSVIITARPTPSLPRIRSMRMYFRPEYLSDQIWIVPDVRSFNLISYLLLVYSDRLNFIFCNHGWI